MKKPFSKSAKTKLAGVGGGNACENTTTGSINSSGILRNTRGKKEW